jgi:peptide deformylase
MCRSEGGVGLAAPQVGESKRLFIIKVAAPYTKMVVINPTISILSPMRKIQDESCLSIPGEFFSVSRYDRVALRGFNDQGLPIHVRLHGFLARIAQHEYDHLEGVTLLEKGSEVA